MYKKILIWILISLISLVGIPALNINPIDDGQISSVNLFSRSLICLITGCTMEGDIDMGGNSIFNVNWVNKTNTNINGTLNVDENITGQGFANALQANRSEDVHFDKNVGIGTTTPDYPLSFGATTGTKIQLYDTGSNLYGLAIQASDLQIGSGGATTKITLRQQPNGAIWLQADANGVTIPNGDLDVTGNITGNQIYGEMWYHNHTATELDFAVDGLFYNLTFDNSDLNGFTFNDAEDSLTPLVNGKYKVSWMASGDGQNNHEYYTTILVNGVDYDRCEAHKKMTAGGDIVTMTGNCFVDLVTTDYVQLGTADVGATGTGNYYSANLNLIRIGD